jgi:DNA-binding protein H-NS
VSRSKRLFGVARATPGLDGSNSDAVGFARDKRTSADLVLRPILFTVPGLFLCRTVGQNARSILLPFIAEAGMALKTMSISKLMDLRQKVDALLASKVAEERRALQFRLSNLGRVGSASMPGRRGGLRGKVAPKYRNPENPDETWAGRGLKPRWLTVAIKAGKKLEDYSITAPAKKAVGRKARKSAK